jgi:glycosyltransferase involved in cell wall biosynthesis
MDKNKLWLVMPVHNEKIVLGQTLDDVFAEIENVIVVDDGSTDGSAEIAFLAGAHVLRHHVNLGQGAALQTGIDYAARMGANYVVTFDADGQHKSEEILPMLDALQKSSSEIILGSRFLGATKNLPPARRILLKLAIFLTRLVGGPNLTDTHNGFRIMQSDFFKKFEFQSNGMGHASEILFFISKNKIRYIEYPVTISYSEYSMSKGQGNINAIKILFSLILEKITK